MTRAIVPDRNAGRDSAKTRKPRIERPVQGDRPPDITLDLMRFKPLVDSLGDEGEKYKIDMPRFSVPTSPVRIELSREGRDLEAAGIEPSFERELGLRCARAADFSMGL